MPGIRIPIVVVNCSYCECGQNFCDGLSVLGPFKAVDRCSQVGPSHDKVHVKVTVGIKVQRLGTLLWSGPEMSKKERPSDEAIFIEGHFNH